MDDLIFGVRCHWQMEFSCHDFVMQLAESIGYDRTMLNHTKEITPCLNFANALCAVLQENHWTFNRDEYEQLGAEIAEIQSPPRYIPYGNYTVQGWLEGELLPTAQAMKALVFLLKNDYGCPEESLSNLLTMHQRATEWLSAQKYQPDELSHAMRTIVRGLGVNIPALCDSDRNSQAINPQDWRFVRQWNQEVVAGLRLPQSVSGWGLVLNGHPDHAGSYEKTCALMSWEQRRVADTGGDGLKPSLYAVHEQMLRERADLLWQHAEENNNLGEMLKAIRVRHGEGMADFGRRLDAFANVDASVGISRSAYALQQWERNQAFPRKGLAGALAMCDAYRLVAKFADVAPNPLSQAIPEPWFTTEKEDMLLAAFMRSAATFRETEEIRVREQVPLPEATSLPEELLRYKAGMAKSLVNGNQRPSTMG